MISFEELLMREGRLVYKAKGVSMKPMLYQDRDLVVIEKVRSRLQPMDVAFYRRGQLSVLHRVIFVQPDGYLIRGDNTYSLETVSDTAVLGVLTSFVRNGKMYQVTDRSYQLYVRFWCAIFPLRSFCYKSLQLSKRLIKWLIHYEK